MIRTTDLDSFNSSDACECVTIRSISVPLIHCLCICRVRHTVYANTSVKTAILRACFVLQYLLSNKLPCRMCRSNKLVEHEVGHLVLRVVFYWYPFICGPAPDIGNGVMIE